MMQMKFRPAGCSLISNMTEHRAGGIKRQVGFVLLGLFLLVKNLPVCES
jgi:hypothetical protein